MQHNPLVYLAPLRDEHVSRYLTLSADPILIATMGWEPFKQEEVHRFRAYMESITVPYMQSGGTVAFSIMSREDQTPVGYLSLKGIRNGNPGAEVGLAIMNSAYRGRGLGTEALREATEYAFAVLELSLLALTVFTDNLGAIRSYEKLGFTKTELLIDSWSLPDGTLADMWVMELYRRSGRTSGNRCDTPPSCLDSLSQAQ